MIRRTFSTITTGKKSPTAVVMMNMGGPATLDKVEFFLRNLFSDGDIIPLGKFQKTLGQYIAKRRSPKIIEQYKAIGGGSPILHWTNVQGQSMCQHLDRIHPETAPHKHYVAFRYANPLTEEALVQMKKDGVQRAIAFSQYPQYSCTTSGSSMNHLWKELRRLDMGDSFKWSLIDRWNMDNGYISAIVQCIRRGLEMNFSPEERSRVVIMFSAHSIPMKTVNKGDPYTMEIASTTERVMQMLNLPNAHILSWQSKVGFLPWMGPGTSSVIKGLGKQGHKNVLVVPIAFTSDHIETLYEIDIEYKEEAHAAGIKNFYRAPSLNDEPLLSEAMAKIVANHLQNGDLHSSSYPLLCPGCTNSICRSIMNPIYPYHRLSDQVNGLPTPQTTAELQ